MKYEWPLCGYLLVHYSLQLETKGEQQKKGGDTMEEWWVFVFPRGWVPTPSQEEELYLSRSFDVPSRGSPDCIFTCAFCWSPDCIEMEYEESSKNVHVNLMD